MTTAQLLSPDFTNTGEAESSVWFGRNLDVIAVTTNEYPNWLIFQGLIQDGGAYASTPSPQRSITNVIYLYGPDYLINKPNELIVSSPTFGELGWLGRSNPYLSASSNWDESFQPLEILPLDPLSAEAWDWPKTQAGPQYEGILRFNVVGISKNIGNLEYENFIYYDGQDVTLTNDVYGAHTQPSGLYH